MSALFDKEEAVEKAKKPDDCDGESEGLGQVIALPVAKFHSWAAVEEICPVRMGLTLLGAMSKKVDEALNGNALRMRVFVTNRAEPIPLLVSRDEAPKWLGVNRVKFLVTCPNLDDNTVFIRALLDDPDTQLLAVEFYNGAKLCFRLKAELVTH